MLRHLAADAHHGIARNSTLRVCARIIRLLKQAVAADMSLAKRPNINAFRNLSNAWGSAIDLMSLHNIDHGCSKD
eukprot:10805372-Karenia_brevis.AAC.1